MNDKSFYISNLTRIYSPEHAQQVFAWLWEKVSNKPFSFYITHSYTLTSHEQSQFEGYIDQLVNHHYPLQYILGSIFFGEVELVVEPPVLIPRPETEEWVYKVINSLSHYKNEPLSILDMCTGSGCIAVSLAHYFKNATVDAVDLYQKPLELTQKNALKNGCGNLNVIQSDLFSALVGKKYDLIFANPPYIDHAVWQTLSPNVKEWEDYHALVADEQGLGLYKQLLSQAFEYLKKNSIITGHARFYTEIGYDQGRLVGQLCQKAGFSTITIYKDFAGKDRMISAW